MDVQDGSASADLPSDVPGQAWPLETQAHVAAYRAYVSSLRAAPIPTLDELGSLHEAACFLATEYTNPLVVDPEAGLPPLPTAALIEDALILAFEIYAYLADVVQHSASHVRERVADPQTLALHALVCWRRTKHPMTDEVTFLRRFFEHPDPAAGQRWIEYLLAGLLFHPVVSLPLPPDMPTNVDHVADVLFHLALLQGTGTDLSEPLTSLIQMIEARSQYELIWLLRQVRAVLVQPAASM